MDVSAMLESFALPVVDEAALGWAGAILLAAILGEAVAMRAWLPRLAGYSAAGLVAGPLGLGWIDIADVREARLVVDFALALVLFELGARVNPGWLVRNPWIAVTSLAESAFTFVGGCAAATALGADPRVAVAAAAIAVATSPVVLSRLATETRARGQVTERMLMLTALNVIHAVVLWKVAVGLLHASGPGGWVEAVAHPVYMLAGSLLAGAVLAAAYRALHRITARGEAQAAAVTFGMLLLAVTLLQAFRLPPILGPLAAGMLLRLADARTRPVLAPLAAPGGVLVIVLLLTTGAAVTYEGIALGGGIALALVGVRALGKFAGVMVFGHASGIGLRKSAALGCTLLPLSAVAFVLVDDMARIDAAFGVQLGAVVFSMVALLEPLGAIVARVALGWSGDVVAVRHGA